MGTFSHFLHRFPFVLIALCFHRAPAEPASISLSQQSHPAKTISRDWLILDWTGWLLFQRHWLWRELQSKITPLIAFQFLMECARISNVLPGCFCFAPLTTLTKTNWLHYRAPNVHSLFALIKWHVFALPWNVKAYSMRLLHGGWCFFQSLISHQSPHGSYLSLCARRCRWIRWTCSSCVLWEGIKPPAVS